MDTKIIDIKGAGTVHSFWFDSMSEARDRTVAASEQAELRAQFRNPRWMGCTYEEMEDRIEHGWSEGAAMLNSMARDVQDLEVMPANAIVRKRKRARGDSGDVLQMSRVWSGQLDTAWDRMRKISITGRSNRYVSIFINFWSNASVKWRETLWRGVAALKLCDALQRSGRQVRISVGMVSQDAYKDYRGKCVHAVRVKDYLQPLNVDSLALMSTAMFLRTIGWRMYYAARPGANAWMGRLVTDGSDRLVWPHPIIEDEIQAKAMLVRIDQVYSKDDLAQAIRSVREQLSKEPT